LRETKALILKKKSKPLLRKVNDALAKLGADEFTEQEAEEVRLLAEMDAVKTALYRHFDADGRLLYVGISMSAMVRQGQHKRHAPWFLSIATIRLEWYGSRGAAESAERKAIETEKTLHNVIFNNGHTV
jgi:hypothetical protein